MRGFIKFSAGVFVVLGIIGFFIAALGVVASLSRGSPGAALAGGSVVILAAAALALVGGTAYMLCRIDERLEELNERLKSTG